MKASVYMFGMNCGAQSFLNISHSSSEPLTYVLPSWYDLHASVMFAMSASLQCPGCMLERALSRACS